MADADDDLDTAAYDPGITTRPDMETRVALGIMTPDELASALGVFVGTLKQWRYRGVGPPYTTAERRVYYRYDDVRAYLMSNVSNPVPTVWPVPPHEEPPSREQPRSPVRTPVNKQTPAPTGRK